MFGFLKPKPAPEGPVQFGLEIEIEKPAEEVYPLIDWADPRNAKRQLGHRVDAVRDKPGRFEMYLDGLDGHVFEMMVTDEVPGREYGFHCVIRPTLGRLKTSHELYSLEPTGENSCRLQIITIAEFVEGMRMKHFEEEVAMMSIATHNALAKFKIHAEEGVEGVRAVEERLVV